MEKYRTANRLGIQGELAAVNYLRGQGYQILARRYKSKFGEIDLLVTKGLELRAVEVKSKSRKDAVIGAVVTSRQCKRIINGTRDFLSEHPDYQQYNITFDVVLFRPDCTIEYLPNAWNASDFYRNGNYL